MWGNVLRHRWVARQLLRRLPHLVRGHAASRRLAGASHRRARPHADDNRFRRYFLEHRDGPGIWKWLHYFDAYDRHLSRFIGREVHIAEVGVYSGGSLAMWRDVLGPRCHVYGIDVAPECKAYENEYTRIFIGDQADRAFWARFRDDVPTLDIVIDDGGHEVEQQVVTLEETLPHLASGGVFMCEDVHGAFNPFAAYMHGLHDALNAVGPRADAEAPVRYAYEGTPFQRLVASVHQYPFLTVIERSHDDSSQLVSVAHGTEWQPQSFWKSGAVAAGRPPGAN